MSLFATGPQLMLGGWHHHHCSGFVFFYHSYFPATCQVKVVQLLTSFEKRNFEEILPQNAAVRIVALSF